MNTNEYEVNKKEAKAPLSVIKHYEIASVLAWKRSTKEIRLNLCPTSHQKEKFRHSIWILWGRNPIWPLQIDGAGIITN